MLGNENKTSMYGREWVQENFVEIKKNKKYYLEKKWLGLMSVYWMCVYVRILRHNWMKKKIPPRGTFAEKKKPMP